MLKTSPDRFDRSSGSACRPNSLSLSGAYVTLLVGQAGNLKRQRASEVAGFAATMIGAAAFIGWWASLPMLSSWVSGFARMKPMTGLCLTALGLALMHPGKNSRFAVAVGLAVAVVAALTLLGVDFGINAWLVPQGAVLEPGPASSRMMIGMPLVMAPVGTSLALSRFEKHRFAAIVLAGVGGIMPAFALLAYVAGVAALSGAVQAPPLPSLVGNLCVIAGIILRIGTMAAFQKPRPLWRLLIMLACAIITPLVLLAAYTGFRVTDAQFDQARKDLMNEAHTLSAKVDHEISSEIERLQVLAASPSLRQGDFAAFHRRAEASVALRQGGNIMLVDRDMRQLVNTWVPSGKPLKKVIIAGPVERALATGKLQITNLFTGPRSQQLTFAIIVPVKIDGENRYALVRSPTRRVLADLVAAHELPPGWLAVVTDAAHRIIARSDQEDAFIGRELPPAQWQRAEPAGVFEFTESEGQPSLEAYTRSKLTGWETAVSAPKALIDAPVRTTWWTIGLTALLGFSLVLGLALWLGRVIAHSVSHTAHAAIALGAGGPLPVAETPVAEVNMLMDELRGAAARRHEAEQDLQASKDQLQVSKDRLQLAFDATRLGWWQYDLLRHVGSGDARFKEIFDVTADEISIEDLMKRVHPDDVERFSANRQAALDPVNPAPYVHQEYRVRRPDGTVRWVEANALSYFEGAGFERRAVSLGGTVQDITERKEREEKEHFLMREVNHRAKNMLSVVDSIAHQTAARSPEDFIECFSERIQALSANQDLLVRNEWKGVDIADLVRAQLAHFADLIGSRIGVHGPKLRFTAASAQAIGLALHELATNAGKYGALSTDRGRVYVSWGTVDDNFTLSWTEREGPPVSAPKRRGFGTIVMEAMTERSIDGKVELNYAPSGLSWRLTCPTGNALERTPKATRVRRQ
jgi:PAS domain S-box-containing protein